MKAGLETGTFVQHLMLIRSQISHHFIVYMLLSLNFPQNTQKKDSDTRQSSNMLVGFLCRCDDDKGTIVFFFFSLRFYRLNICWKICQNPWHYGQHKRENHDYLLLHSIPSMIHLEPYIFFHFIRGPSCQRCTAAWKSVDLLICNIQNLSTTM